MKNNLIMKYFKRNGLFFICLFVCISSVYINSKIMEKQKYTYCGSVVDRYNVVHRNIKVQYYVLKNNEGYKEVEIDSFHNLGDYVCVTVYNPKSILEIVLIIIFIVSLFLGCVDVFLKLLLVGIK